jgi:uncharacterized protein YjbI with pentapeptide repeats
MIDYLLWLGTPLLLNLFVYVYRTNNRTTMRLKGMSLQPGSNFVNKKLRFAQLQGLDLSGSNFSGANLECANLSGSNLERCCFERASLRNANCSKANLMQVCVRWADIDGANFDGATINGMKIYEDQIEKTVNLNANVLDVYDRRTNERIKSLKQIFVQDKLRHSEGTEKVKSKATKLSVPHMTHAKSTVNGEGNSEAKFFLCANIDFSHANGVPFSLKNEMSKVGFRDIGDFFQQLVKVVEASTALVDLSKRIARISNQDFFRTTVARLLNAVSYNSEVVKDSDIKDWVVAADIAGLGMISQRRLSESLFKIVHRAVTNSIRTQGLQGVEIVRQLEVGAVAWEQVSDGKTVFGDDSEAARSLLIGVVLQSILHSLKSAESTQNVIESLSGTKGQNLSLRDEMRLMTELGRQYAKAHAIDYDHFVERLADFDE